MTSVSHLGNSAASFSIRASRGTPANARAELAKYESQLSDWVHCASSKTSEGKAKIAEITDKIASIKSQVRQAEDAQELASPQRQAAPSSNQSIRPLRLDHLGAWLDTQA